MPPFAHTVTVEPRFGFGLRGRLILVLSVAFAIAFGLLSLAARQLDRRQRADEHTAISTRVAETIATQLSAAPAEQFDRVVTPLVARSTIQGAQLVDSSGAIRARGATKGSSSAVVSVAGDAKLHVWLQKPIPRGGFSDPLLLYVGVTGAAILLLVYIFLTYLIVRPVDGLRGASERLARGNLYTSVPVEGATEIARLSSAFNQMADQLRQDRVALQQRLDELERTTTELEDTQDHLIRTGKLAAVGRLSAGIAHEIGNPLAAIQGLLELLQSQELTSADAAEFIDRIQRETERIHLTIRDLLDFSRHDALAEEGGDTDLQTVISDTVRLVAPQKRFEGIRIHTELASDVPHVRGSSDRLGQLFLNLLFNAADAMEGTGTISIEARRASEASDVLVQVADSGPGVDEALIDQIFDPFFTTKPAGKGTGLGLAVCQTLVDRLGGSITVSNRAQGGACFEVRLPAS